VSIKRAGTPVRAWDASVMHRIDPASAKPGISVPGESIVRIGFPDNSAKGLAGNCGNAINLAQIDVIRRSPF
jgi:hypothetical protein